MLRLPYILRMVSRMCSKRRLIELLSLIIGLFGLWVQLSDDYFDLHSTHTS